jgi:hypothetical protein
MGGTRPSRAERADAAERAEHAAYKDAARAWTCARLAETEDETADILADYLRVVGA